MFGKTVFFQFVFFPRQKSCASQYYWLVLVFPILLWSLYASPALSGFSLSLKSLRARKAIPHNATLQYLLKALARLARTNVTGCYSPTIARPPPIDTTHARKWLAFAWPMAVIRVAMKLSTENPATMITVQCCLPNHPSKRPVTRSMTLFNRFNYFTPPGNPKSHHYRCRLAGFT